MGEKQKYLTVPITDNTAKLLEEFKDKFGVNKKKIVEVALLTYINDKLKKLN